MTCLHTEQHKWFRSRYCGVEVCDVCGEHKGLARCYCGWAASGDDGYRELVEAGEQIEPDDY